MSEITEYWDKIPCWNPENNKGSFDVLSDEFSGRIPVTRLEHWSDYTKLLESDFFNQHDTQFVFRGHRRHDWAMTPTLGRLTPNGIVTQELANEQIELFRKAIRGRIADHSLLDDENEREADELWSIGQHHGLMTPLLDWTYSPYVALFFAFAKQDRNDEKDNPYRAIYILNKSFISDDEICPDIRVFEPRKDDHGRLVSQAGLFTFSPFDATIENKLIEVLTSEDFEDDELKNASEEEQAAILAKYICKVYIKNEDQQSCLKHLRRMNVHHASLFPDLIGAADYCNIFITENVRSRKEKLKSVEAKVEGEPSSNQEPNATETEEPNPTSLVSISDLLSHSLNGAEFSTGLLESVSEELQQVLAKGKLVDWEERDTLQAEMKNKTRVILRKSGYPESARQQVIDNILFVGEEDRNNDE